MFQRWIQGGQYQMSFDDFKRELRPPEFKSDREIMADAETIINSMVG